MKKSILAAFAAILLCGPSAEAGDGRFVHRYGGWVANSPAYRPWGYSNYHYRYRYWYGPGVRRAPRPRLYQGVDAWAHDIRARWSLQDEAKARRRAEQEEKRKRREEYRAKHPPKPAGERHFVHKGVKYKNMEEFKKTDAYLEMLADREIQRARNAAKEKMKEERRQAAVESERRRRLYNRPMIFLQEEDRQRRIAREALGDGWFLKREKPWVYDEDSISFKIADKIAKRHGITRGEAWEKYPGEISQELQKHLPPHGGRPYTVLPKKD